MVLGERIFFFTKTFLLCHFRLIWRPNIILPKYGGGGVGGGGGSSRLLTKSQICLYFFSDSSPQSPGLGAESDIKSVILTKFKQERCSRLTTLSMSRDVPGILRH